MRKPPRPLFWFALVAAVLIATAAYYPELAALLKSIFPGKTKWDYLEKIFIPVFPPALVAVGIWWLNKRETARQEKRAEDQRESEVVTEFLELMTPLILEKGLCQATKQESVVAVGRSLIVATLSRLRSEAAPRRRTTIMRYMFEAGVTNQAGIFDLRDVNLIGANLSMADLSGANLCGARLSMADLFLSDLSGAYLSGARLFGAHLIGANLSMADLSGARLKRADLSGARLFAANLSGANLSEANLSGADLWAIWDEGTKWPISDNFKDAMNIPSELKKQLGLS